MNIVELTRTINKLPDATIRKCIQEIVDHFQMATDALRGDMILEITPTAVNRVAASTAFTRTVHMRLKNAAGKTHEWCNLALTTRLAIADTSQAGAATIPSTTLTFVNGRASVVITGSAHAWLEGETNVLTVSTLTINGMSVTGGTSTETVIAAE